MRKLLSLDHSLEALSAVLAGAGMLQTFIIGMHFVIPTMILGLVVLLANLARFGMRGDRWAKHLVFWLFAVIGAHAFFALFWAGEASPGTALGSGFYPVYGGTFLVLSGLCATYAHRNRLLR
jgi:hypothetical protein